MALQGEERGQDELPRTVSPELSSQAYSPVTDAEAEIWARPKTPNGCKARSKPVLFAFWPNVSTYLACWNRLAVPRKTCTPQATRH